MPYKRDGSPYYYIRRTKLPGYGDTGRISSRVTSKKIARDMERCLEEISHKALLDPSWRPLLDAVCKEKSISLVDLLAERNRGTLPALKSRLSDPPLKKAVQDYLAPGGRDRNAILGLEQVLEAAPKDARLSVLRDGAYVTQLLSGMEGSERMRNTIVRQAKRGISLLLRFHLGNAERNRIFADVDYAAEDDTREVHLSRSEIRRLLEACEELGGGDHDGYREMAVLIMAAIQTSADRGVLLSGKGSHGRFYRGTLSKDVQVFRDNETGLYQGTIYLYDTKTPTRSRTQPITDRLCRELLVCLKGKAPEQPVFDMRYRDMDYYWKQVRKSSKLTHITFKDLRSQYSIYAEEAGIPLTTVSKSMGHASATMTLRYQRRKAALTPDQARALEEAIFGKTG